MLGAGLAIRLWAHCREPALLLSVSVWIVGMSGMGGGGRRVGGGSLVPAGDIATWPEAAGESVAFRV